MTHRMPTPLLVTEAIHVLVGRLEDLSRELAEIETKSRDFR